MLSSILQDLRYTLRSSRKRPGAALVIIITLALGIGINSAFFTGVYAMVWRPLPFVEPDELVEVFHAQARSGESWISLSSGAFFEFAENVEGLEGAGAYRIATYNLRSDALPERVSGAQISGELFDLLGVRPAQGRLLSPQDDRPGAPGVVLLSDDLWRRSFGSDPQVLGRVVHLNGEAHEVVGVMPPGFAFPLWQEAWTPLRLERGAAPQLSGGLHMIGRLAPGATVDSVQPSFDAVVSVLAQQFPDNLAGAGVKIRSLHDSWLPPVTQVAGIVMQGLVTLVLLIVCANVANMVLARATSRRRELALRAALGADRRRLVRQALVESWVLSCIGGGLGLIVAAWNGAWLEKVSPVGIPYWLEMSLNGHVVVYTLIISTLTAVGIGLLPALRASRFDLVTALESSGRSDGGTSSGDGRFRSMLVAAEYALAVVVLVGASLMVRSYDHLRNDDVGFAIEDRMSLRVSLQGDSYDAGRRAEYLEGAIRYLSTLAEVESVAAMSFLPVSQDGFRGAGLEVSGQVFEEGAEPRATVQGVSMDYFETFGIPLRSGRFFNRGEMTASEKETRVASFESETRSASATQIQANGRSVVIIDRELASHLWPGGEALGRQIRTAEEAPWLTVIGVVAPVDPGEPIAGVDGRPPFQVYLPMTSRPDLYLGRSPALVVASSAAPSVLGPTLRQALAAYDADVPVYDVLPMATNLERYYFAQHLWSRMFSAIALVALLIAAVGAYGVSSYAISRRRKEMGIRMALGAHPRELMGRVVLQNVLVAGIGLGVGLVLAWPMARGMGALLHGVEMDDPVVLGASFGLLSFVALAASYGPARRAASVDPIQVLRED